MHLNYEKFKLYLQNTLNTLKTIMVYFGVLHDKDVKFVSYFLKTIWKLFGTILKISYALHLQNDGQTKVVNCSLGDMLRCLVGGEIRCL